MKRSRFTEEPIIKILKEHKSGITTGENTFYKWKSKYGGMEVSDAKRLKLLEDVNSKQWCRPLTSKLQPFTFEQVLW